MIGLTALAILVFYILSVRKLAGFIARRAGFDHSAVKVGAVFFFLFILPFVDEIVGRLQFQHECRKVQGYHVYDSIEHATLAKYGDARLYEQLATFIPIKKATGQVVNAIDGTVLLSYETLSTPGGWVMRMGLNLGNSSYCNTVNSPKIMALHGFRLVDGEYFEKISGKQLK
jgi:hypothetical protein